MEHRRSIISLMFNNVNAAGRMSHSLSWNGSSLLCSQGASELQQAIISGSWYQISGWLTLRLAFTLSAQRRGPSAHTPPRRPHPTRLRATLRTTALPCACSSFKTLTFSLPLLIYHSYNCSISHGKNRLRVAAAILCVPQTDTWRRARPGDRKGLHLLPSSSPYYLPPRQGGGGPDKVPLHLKWRGCSFYWVLCDFVCAVSRVWDAWDIWDIGDRRNVAL